MSFFNRGLWKQKPQMYGPVSAVQRDIWMNSERCGIDPGSIDGFWPLWETVGEPNQYITLAPQTKIGSPVWDKNTYHITDNTDSLVTDIYFNHTFTIIARILYTTTDNLQFIGTNDGSDHRAYMGMTSDSLQIGYGDNYS